MRSIIIYSIFAILIGILFYSLFKQPVQQNTSSIRKVLRDNSIAEKQERYFQTQLNICQRKIYEEADSYVDSLIRSEYNPLNTLDTLSRRYRPTDPVEIRQINTEAELKPLFTDIDTLE